MNAGYELIMVIAARMAPVLTWEITVVLMKDELRFTPEQEWEGTVLYLTR